MKRIIYVLIFGLFVCNMASAQYCVDTPYITTPDDNFIINNDGTVRDITTGLTWMRCPIGQDWNGTTCTGTPITYTWYDASEIAADYVFANNSSWRLPKVQELYSIVELSCYQPAINLNIFPNTLPGDAYEYYYYWTSMTYMYPKINSKGEAYRSDAWLVHFSSYATTHGRGYNKERKYPIRLVRD